MDPLSLPAGVIAILQLTASTIRLFQELREVSQTLPGRLQALQEEVVDLQAVLEDVSRAHEERIALLPAAGGTHLPALLDHATNKLLELQRMLRKLTQATRLSSIRIVQAQSWRKHHDRLKTLQDDLRSIKTNLNLLLGTLHSRDLVTVRLQAEAILSCASQESDQRRHLEEELRRHMAVRRATDADATALQSSIDERLERVEQSIREQGSRLYENQSERLGLEISRRTQQRVRAARGKDNMHQSVAKGAHGDAIGIRLTRQVGLCRPQCPCACHKQQKATTPTVLDRWLGQLSVEMSGVPMFKVRCDEATCERAQSPQASVEYWFPQGFLWSQIIRIRMGYQPNIGPQLQLSMLRRVPDSAPAVEYAMEGNIQGLQALFRRGLASPRDVSSTRGYTMLRWAMYAKQYQTCKFLLHAGADPDYRPISPYDNSPRNKANDFILQGGLSREAEEIYRQIAAGSDYIDEQNYTPLHKAVLGLTFRPLEELIEEFPNDIEKRCAMGRTPLSWAACRGNERDIVLLLAYGADPNTVDVQLSGPVSNAADRGHTTCVRLLLEAHADPDPVRPGVSKGSPLNCASRNANDVLLVKTLLDFGADIEACGVDGVTPMIHVARRDQLDFAQLLLDYGANINAMSSAQQTPLTFAITHNSHRVLKLLLERWYEYSECPRLKGPHLLLLVATFADVETMEILTATDHVRLSYDPAYKIMDHIAMVEKRHDTSPKLQEAFKKLLGVIDGGTRREPTADGELEAGRNTDIYDDLLATPASEDSDGSSEVEGFEDASEEWAAM